MDIILEGLLFVIGDEGLSKEDIAKLLEVDINKVEELVSKLKDYYDTNNRAITIECLGEKYKLVTRQKHHEYYEKLALEEQNKTLTQSSLETLAIIAYNEPITRSQIDEIRGVASSYIVRKLMLKDLVEIAGRQDSPGRPILLKTTNKFLDYFGLKSKNELPKIETEEIKDEEINLFESKYKEGV